MTIRSRKLNFVATITAITLLSTTAVFAANAPKPAPEMQAVLDKLAALEAKPVSTLTVPQARTQASPADAANAIMLEKKISAKPESQVKTKDIGIPTKSGVLPARVYMPEGKGLLISTEN